MGLSIASFSSSNYSRIRLTLHLGLGRRFWTHTWKLSFNLSARRFGRSLQKERESRNEQNERIYETKRATEEADGFISIISAYYHFRRTLRNHRVQRKGIQVWCGDLWYIQRANGLCIERHIKRFWEDFGQGAGDHRCSGRAFRYKISFKFTNFGL